MMKRQQTFNEEEITVKALVYEGPGAKSWKDVPDPVIQDDGDAIVRVDATTICGTDLHILKGDVPETTPGRILGHEAVGTVVEVGSGVKTRQVGRSGARVVHLGVWTLPLLPGGPLRAVPRRRRMDPRAPHRRDPGRAGAGSFCRHLDLPVPDGASDEEILMLADILPTSYEVGVLNGHVQPGDTVAIVGAGPIGLSAILGARLFSPSHIIAIDLADARLEAAKHFGADITINNGREDALAIVRSLTDGLGADVAIEAVGVPESFELCTELVRPGGHVANIGVHGKPATLHLESLWIRDVTVTTGLVDTYSTPTLLRLVASHQVDAERFVSHHFELDQMLEAYDVFGRAAETGALKVVITR